MMIFCVDLGGTKSRAGLYDGQGTLLASAVTGAGAVSLGAARGISAVETLWAEVSRDRDIARAQTVAALGIAGIGLSEAVGTLRAALGDFGRTICVNDGYGALIDATGGAPGTLIVVGTGIAALRLDGAGQCHIASGWGFPGGDLGAGAWIGLQASGALTRALDAPDAPGAATAALTDRLMDVTGRTAPDIMDWITGARATQYAQLAPLVAASPDPVARAIMAQAGRHIAEVACGLAPDGAKHGDAPADTRARTVHLSGGLATVVAGACGAAEDTIDWVVTDTDPLRGLWRLATGAAPVERLAPRPGLGQVDYATVETPISG